MLLSKVCLLATIVVVANAETEKPIYPIDMGFDYFLNPANEELARTRPLEFNAEDGKKFRKEYEDKFGYRGERLIAMLGGPAPLSIFDAAVLDKTVTNRAPVDQEIETTTEAVSNSTDEKPVPKQKNYIEIDRDDRKKGFLSESFLQNNIPRKESYKISPDGVIYKRLFGAVWNHGAEGLQKNFGLTSLDGLKKLGIPSLPGFYSPTWSDIPSDFGKQISASLQSQLNSDWTRPRVNEELVNKPSQKEFAGVGEPSIMVQSYSYR